MIKYILVVLNIHTGERWYVYNVFGLVGSLHLTKVLPKADTYKKEFINNALHSVQAELPKIHQQLLTCKPRDTIILTKKVFMTKNNKIVECTKTYKCEFLANLN